MVGIAEKVGIATSARYRSKKVPATVIYCVALVDKHLKTYASWKAAHLNGGAFLVTAVVNGK